MSTREQERLQELLSRIQKRKYTERISDYPACSIRPDDKNPSFHVELRKLLSLTFNRDLLVKSNDQWRFFHSTAKERWAIGANRSGKTESCVVDCYLLCMGEHPVWSKVFPPPVNVRYCGPSYEDNLRGVVLTKFKELGRDCDFERGLIDDAWSEKTKTLKFRNGSKVNMKSFEQKLNKFGGVKLHAVYEDEHGPAEYFRENMARLVDYNGIFVSGMTPEEGAITWERKYLSQQADNPNIEKFNFTMIGNPHIKADAIIEMIRRINDLQVLRVKILGEFASLAGLLYPTFDQRKHLIDDFEVPNDWYKMIIIDPHIKTATAIIWMAVNDEGERFIYRCAKIRGTISDIKQFILAQSSGESIKLWLCDEAMGGVGRNIYGQESVLREMRKEPNPLPFRGTNQNSTKAFEAGVQRVRELLAVDPISGRPSLFVFRSCYGVVDEFEEYQFMPDKSGDEMTFRERVRKVEDHYMDDIRYGCMVNAWGVGKRKYNQKMSRHPASMKGIFRAYRNTEVQH